MICRVCYTHSGTRRHLTFTTLLDRAIAGWVECHVGGLFPLGVAQVGGALVLVGTDN
jgi:hypothetical protein